MARGSAPSVSALLAASAIASAATFAGSARADERPEPIRIVMSAPRGCPPSTIFERELRDRTRRPWIRAGRESARTLRVVITSSEGVFRGRLLIEEPSGSSRSDEVPWEHCDDVVSALAVKAAIAVDGSRPRPMPPMIAALPRAPVWEEPRWSFRPAPVQLIDRPQPWRVSVGAGLLATGSISPGLTPAAALYLDVSRIGEGLEALTVRLSLLRAIDDFQANGEIVAVEWIASRLEVCPLHRRFPPFTLSPCLAVDTGAIEFKIAQPGVARHWVAVDLIARVQATFFKRLVLEVQAGVILPLTHYEFGLGESRLSGKSLHEVPVVSGMVGGATGVRFP